jgi:hypothetical protein
MGSAADRRSEYEIPTEYDWAKVSILILRAKTNRMEDLLPLMPACSEALRSIVPGQVVEVGPLKAR